MYITHSISDNITIGQNWLLFCIPSKKSLFSALSFRMSHRSEHWYTSSSPNDQFFKAKINSVKRSTGGFHWPRVEMQYLIKTSLYCVTITIQTSCLAGVVSIDSGLELIYQFVSCLQVKEQRNRRLEERKGEISLIGSAAVLLNAEIKGSMCFGFAYIDFLPSFHSLLDKHKHVHSFLLSWSSYILFSEAEREAWALIAVI